MKKDSIDSLDSSLTGLNDYQKNRIKNKIKNENNFFGKLDNDLNKLENKKPINLKKTNLPIHLRNTKETLNNEERKKYNEMFNRVNFSNKPSVSKSDLTIGEKVRLLYK
jgi:hypothetical protein